MSIPIKVSVPVREKNEKFPNLFCITKLGKTREWKIWVEGNEFCRSDGNVGGKMKEPTRCEAEPKNVGKTNATTGEEQSQLEAERIWIAQTAKGYKPDKKDVRGNLLYGYVLHQKNRNAGSNRGVKMWGATDIKAKKTTATKTQATHLPMLCVNGTFEKNKHRITYPCYVQPKLDGLRCLAYIKKDGSVSLQSRGGCEFAHLTHIRDQILRFVHSAEGNHVGQIIFDGELYCHGLRRTMPSASGINDDKGIVYHTNKNEGEAVSCVERFQYLTEICKVNRTNAHKFESVVQFNIFDLHSDGFEDPKTSFVDRNIVLQNLFKVNKSKSYPALVYIHATLTKNEEDIIKSQEEAVYRTYEGIIIRNSIGPYLPKYRSKDLIKYKKFFDEECTIIGADEKKGNQKGAVVWRVKDDEGNEFSASQTGTVENARKMFKNYRKYLGLKVTIQYNEKTKDGVPRFPRAIAVRERGV